MDFPWIRLAKKALSGNLTYFLSLCPSYNVGASSQTLSSGIYLLQMAYFSCGLYQACFSDIAYFSNRRLLPGLLSTVGNRRRPENPEHSFRGRGGISVADTQLRRPRVLPHKVVQRLPRTDATMAQPPSPLKTNKRI